MLDVKVFKDGERLCVIFEGLENMDKEEEMIKGLIAGLIETNIKTVSDASVKPVEPEKAPVVNESQATLTKAPVAPVSTYRFTEGEYVGMTPEEVLKTAGNKGGTFLNNFILNEKDEKVKKEVLLTFLSNAKKQFKDTDPKVFANALSDRQVSVFYNRYSSLIPEKTRIEIADTYGCSFDEFLRGDITPKKFEVSKIVEAIKAA